MKKTRPGRRVLATLSLIPLVSTPLLAQEGTGFRGQLSFSQGVEFTENRELETPSSGSSTVSVTDLGFGISSETRAETFFVSIDGRIEGELDGGSSDDFEFVNQGARAGYSRTGPNSRLSYGAQYTKAEIEDELIGFFVDGIFDPDALVIEGGTRERASVSGSFEYGMEGPFGFEVSARVVEVNYTDTTELVDNSSQQVDAAARFALNPSTSLRTVAGYRRTEEEDIPVETRTRTYAGVGVEGELAGGLSYQGDIVFDQTTTDENSIEVDSDEGIGFVLEAQQDRPNGAIGVSLSSRIDSSGRRNEASFNRTMELPQSVLSYSVGVVDQEGDDTALTGAVNYRREMQGGEITANLTQRATTDDGEAVLNTSLNLGLTQDINDVSAWGANVSYGSASDLDGGGADRRASASVFYRRDLTEDWDLSAGVRLTQVDDTDDGNRSSSTVFVNVGRDFNFGF